MRVISGRAKGRNLKAPKGLNTRPTADRVKEALFSVLGRRFVDGMVLDLFAGTGALCIEALSRGAKGGVCVEFHGPTMGVLKENLNLTCFTERVRLFSCDAGKAMKIMADEGSTFDLIFLDPPYDKGLLIPALEGIADSRMLTQEGVLVAETRDTMALPDLVGELELVRRDSYGDTSLAYYQWREED